MFMGSHHAGFKDHSNICSLSLGNQCIGTSAAANYLNEILARRANRKMVQELSWGQYLGEKIQPIWSWAPTSRNKRWEMLLFLCCFEKEPGRGTVSDPGSCGLWDFRMRLYRASALPCFPITLSITSLQTSLTAAKITSPLSLSFCLYPSILKRCAQAGTGWCWSRSWEKWRWWGTWENPL